MSAEHPTQTRTYSWQSPNFDPTKIAHLSGLEYLQAIARGEIPPAPIGATLGMEMPRLDEITEGRVIFRMKPKEFQYNPLGGVHGGVYATLLDSAVGCAIQTMLPAGVMYTTLELKVNYVRPLLDGGPEVQAIGQVVAMTRQTGIAEGRLVDESGKLYAYASTTCLIIRPERK